MAMRSLQGMFETDITRLGSSRPAGEIPRKAAAVEGYATPASKGFGNRDCDGECSSALENEHARRALEEGGVSRWM